MLEIPITLPEMAALEACFIDDMGVGYLAFLNALEPEDPPPFMYVKRMEDIRQANAKGALPELNAETDLEKVLVKIKTKVREKSRQNPWFLFFNFLIQKHEIREERQTEVLHVWTQQNST